MITVCAMFFTLTAIIPAKASSLAAPTVLKVNSFKSYTLFDPVISGVTVKDSNVLVYVDDVLAGYAKIKRGESASDSFYFQIFNLDAGTHSVYLFAEGETGLLRSQKSKEFNLLINALPAPTLVVPNKKTITGKIKPTIEGFTKSGSFVHLYIDGAYNGKTAIVEHESGTAHFVYSPFLNLSVGMHKMWAISESVNGKKSSVSKVLEFNIEEEMPAPIIYEPVVNNNTVYNEPFIVGLAKNDSKIRIFVDSVFVDSFIVKNHNSGVANFSYKSKKLADGKHLVYTTSIDSRGKESLWSNIVYFNTRGVIKEKLAQISENAVEETVSTNNNNKITQERIKDFLVFADLFEKDNKLRLNNEQYQELQSLLDRKNELIISEKEQKKLLSLFESRNTPFTSKVGEKTDDSGDKVDVNIKDVLNGSEKEDIVEKNGSLDETKAKQNKIGWNAFVFILFLIAVIAWIFWVNRELIKEKKEQEEKESK